MPEWTPSPPSAPRRWSGCGAVDDGGRPDPVRPVGGGEGANLCFEHPVAIARLHALWLAWQELTDPATCGYTGPSVWHRDHYDPCIRELRSSTGPFGGCVKGEHQINHRLPGAVPSAWRQAES
ncbi:DUF4913 domain-containing protein [Streptomyces sp. NPDC003027]